MGIVGTSVSGIGVSGQSTEANGVLGLTSAATGSGVFGSNENEGTGVTGLSEAGIGVFGQTNRKVQTKNEPVAGVVGQCNGPGWGILGQSPDGIAGVAGFSDHGDGVFGQTHTDGSTGVHGVNLSSGDGVRGEGKNGIHGIATTSDPLGAGVFGENPINGAAGVLGMAADGYGVVGLSGAVYLAVASAGAGYQAGVIGASENGPGVFGQGVNGQGILASGSPVALETIGNAVIGGSLNVLGKGFFFADLHVLGTLTATTKLFQIDHPLDPANKYLSHACVESSEMKTIYDGIVILDDQGQSVVELPSWFEVLNTNCRYQLTPVGAPAPNLHVVEEISANRFKIAGGSAKLKVCWQVTGIRHDAFAQAQPLEVETDKAPEERGFFLHPEHHGHPQERRIAWARGADLRHYIEPLRTPSEK